MRTKLDKRKLSAVVLALLFASIGLYWIVSSYTTSSQDSQGIISLGTIGPPSYAKVSLNTEPPQVPNRVPKLVKVEENLTREYVRRLAVKGFGFEPNDFHKFDYSLIAEKEPPLLRTMKVDGSSVDWRGRALSPNSQNVSQGEWVWNDRIGDERTDFVSDGSDNRVDLNEFRIAADNEYIYFVAEMNNIENENVATGNGAPQVQVAVDTDLKPGSGNRWLANYADTKVAEEAAWERLISTRFGSDNGAVGVYDENWINVASGTDLEAVSPKSNVIEFRVSWNTLGVPSSTKLRFTVTTCRSDSKNVAWEVPYGNGGTSDVLDAVTELSKNTWEEVSDQVENYSFEENMPEYRRSRHESTRSLEVYKGGTMCYWNLPKNQEVPENLPSQKQAKRIAKKFIAELKGKEEIISPEQVIKVGNVGVESTNLTHTLSLFVDFGQLYPKKVEEHPLLENRIETGGATVVIGEDGRIQELWSSLGMDLKEVGTLKVIPPVKAIKREGENLPTDRISTDKVGEFKVNRIELGYDTAPYRPPKYAGYVYGLHGILEYENDSNRFSHPIPATE